MASTNKTANYELSQFEGTDKPSWEADYNADMLAIDTNLKAVSNVANGASGDISTLDGRLTTAEGNISTNANDIDALEARTDALEAGQTSDDGRLDALEAEQIVQNTAIESNTRLGYNLARPYDSASTYAVGAYVLFQDTLYKCTTAISTGEAFDPNKWLAIKATDEIAAGGYTLPTASASTLGGVKVGNDLSIDGNGVLNYTLPTSSANDLGGVKVGSGLSIDPTGVLSSTAEGWTYIDNFMGSFTNKSTELENATFEIESQRGFYNSKVFIFNAVIKITNFTAFNPESTTTARRLFDFSINGVTLKPNIYHMIPSVSLNGSGETPKIIFVRGWSNTFFVDLFKVSTNGSVSSGNYASPLFIVLTGSLPLNDAT